MEPSRTTSYHKLVNKPDYNPLRTATPEQHEILPYKTEHEENNQPSSAAEETNLPTPKINKIFEASSPNIRKDIISSLNFLFNIRGVLHPTWQSQIDAINAHPNLLPSPKEPEGIFNEPKVELKSKANTRNIKKHITGPMNALIHFVKSFP